VALLPTVKSALRKYISPLSKTSVFRTFTQFNPVHILTSFSLNDYFNIFFLSVYFCKNSVVEFTKTWNVDLKFGLFPTLVVSMACSIRNSQQTNRSKTVSALVVVYMIFALFQDVVTCWLHLRICTLLYRPVYVFEIVFRITAGSVVYCAVRIELPYDSEKFRASSKWRGVRTMRP
jgi:hypothetical protein